MADLSAVLRKTIDALPSATPQLRAKVYEKARTAIQRQIAAANPPLSDEMIEARRRALEEAIASTESHYTGAAPATGSPSPATAQPIPPVAAPPAPPIAATPAAPPPMRYDPPRAPVEPRAEVPAATVASPRAPAPYVPERAPEPRAAPARPPENLPLRPAREIGIGARAAPPIDAPQAGSDGRIGEIGPMSELPAVDADPAPEIRGRDTGRDGLPRFDGIPHADVSAPNYPRPRERRRSAGSLIAGLAALVFVGALGGLGYIYSEEIATAIGGYTETASVETTEPEAPEAPEAEVAAVDPAAEPAPADVAATTPPEPDPAARQFTQRLLPDGSEVDEGPAESAPNAFDEGTDVAAASPVEPVEQTPPGAGATPTTETAAVDPNADPQAVPVGQRAVFYEERSDERPGSQQGGNVVWSVVNEPPAAGEPAEPAIRAVADVGETDLRMTMTIRRNADETLPASHVIEILFDVPDDFSGGPIENVQRLALKPTEQARGEPLIGVAGKISDGFFIIALNDLQQAVDSNLALMGSEQWIDIPMAYANGQRALMSLEKGIPGERVFQEAMDAWAART